jgi:hypothetical protein
MARSASGILAALPDAVPGARWLTILMNRHRPGAVLGRVHSLGAGDMALTAWIAWPSTARPHAEATTAARTRRRFTSSLPSPPPRSRPGGGCRQHQRDHRQLAMKDGLRAALAAHRRHRDKPCHRDCDQGRSGRLSRRREGQLADPAIGSRDLLRRGPSRQSRERGVIQPRVAVRRTMCALGLVIGARAGGRHGDHRGIALDNPLCPLCLPLIGAITCGPRNSRSTPIFRPPRATGTRTTRRAAICWRPRPCGIDQGAHRLSEVGTFRTVPLWL